jgi:hypothetical protein
LHSESPTDHLVPASPPPDSDVAAVFDPDGVETGQM